MAGRTDVRSSAREEASVRKLQAGHDQGCGDNAAPSMGKQNVADFRLAVECPATVRGMPGDCRAGIHVDHLHDLDDRNSGRKLKCQLHVLWSLRETLEILYEDVLAVWAALVDSFRFGKGCRL